MTRQTIVTRTGHVLTGRIIDHLGGGRVEIEVGGKRFTGTKIKHRTDTDSTAPAQ